MNLPDWWPHPKPYAIMDCLEGMRKLPDKCVDLIVTDPPYGLGFDYGDTYQDTRKNLKELITKTMPEILRISKRTAILPGISNVWLYPEPNWVMAITWNTTGSRGYYGYTQWMPILVYGKDIKGMGKVNGVLKSDCYSINGGGNVGFQRKKDEKLHVCPKPLEIIDWLVLRLSNKDEIVLDPFLGSGTLLNTTRRLSRIGLGFEINPDYEPIIRKRMMEDIPKIDEWF